MTSSRLILDAAGIPFAAEVTTADDPAVPIGTRFRVVIVEEPRGRLATPEEQMRTRTPYRAPMPPVLVEVDEDELTDAEALRLCRLEQQHDPVDLLTAA